jgi:putative copper export protein
MSNAGWLAVRWLHVLAMALFVGGQLVLVAAVIPATRGGHRDVLRAIARRFGWASLAALAVLVVTGSALAFHDDRWTSATLHVKLALVVTVGALTAWHIRHPGAHAVEALVFLVSLAIVWLGLALAHGPLPFG